ncbi:MAG TPA: protein translocase subunit SecD [Anaerolineales bacterium]|jgi:preprotein translocase subunit SecD|nr:protein translocase subunit SecD [Anaerolineales bacterium]
MKQYRTLIFILVIVAIAIWMVLPGNPGIHIGSVNRQIQTRLGLDLVGGVQALLEADVPANQSVSAQDMQTARQIVENRVNGLGVSEAVVQQAGERRIVVELPGETDPQKALETIKQTGVLEFVAMDNSPVPVGTTIKTDFASSGEAQPTPGPTETQPAPSPTESGTTQPVTPTTSTQEPIYHTVMTGSDLKTVQVTTSATGEYEVSFTLTDQGTQIFGDYTSGHVGEILGIVLDKQVISTPTINSAITQGSGVITGNFTLESANALAVQLRYGSLPIPLKVVESSTVGPTLGQDSLRKSLIAGIIGLSVVILFMALYYRLPGVLADLALMVYALITFALFKFIPVTLTLPGIAGFVLSIGVAVDANVLIFERLKEELRSGRTLRQAIDLGWNRAWPSIRDSNFSTLITCSILFWFGSTFGASIVKGFAITLAIGVLVSMFTAIIVTRSFLHLVLDNIEFVKHVRWFGV